jgi:alkanesulfonate monooxygenase SsuD/methylene tetrahydromethanopterin reductase-like flavin-dependent oxidoreductase (luciferase family)
MASFPARNPVLLATQWATADHIAGPNRLILAACLGGEGGGGDWQIENEFFGVAQNSRVGRLEEGIEILRTVWMQKSASFSGKYYQFKNITGEPRPVSQPSPAIWIASNPRATSKADAQSSVNRATRRIVRLSTGWMTTWLTPEDFADRWQLIQAGLRDEGKDVETFDKTLYYNANINDNREAAAAESKRFLDTYYGFDITRPRLDVWVAYGSPSEIIDKIHQFIEAGAKEITFRLTSWDQAGQLRRLTEEVIPAFD